VSSACVSSSSHRGESVMLAAMGWCTMLHDHEPLTAAWDHCLVSRCESRGVPVAFAGGDMHVPQTSSPRQAAAGSW
jgi:hypothetical protein